jgi:hypothetical protein
MQAIVFIRGIGGVAATFPVNAAAALPNLKAMMGHHRRPVAPYRRRHRREVVLSVERGLREHTVIRAAQPEAIVKHMRTINNNALLGPKIRSRARVQRGAALPPPKCPAGVDNPTFAALTFVHVW